ncbi:effector-associated constant component EACC1 [Kitasatospora purpeofusca]|uniref:effector-associated constant component EACC1 n=1 Tax=Kitasatospora purpeofusca TaxID=67352 RepID=UPI003824EB08
MIPATLLAEAGSIISFVAASGSFAAVLRAWLTRRKPAEIRIKIGGTEIAVRSDSKDSQERIQELLSRLNDENESPEKRDGR